MRAPRRLLSGLKANQALNLKPTERSDDVKIEDDRLGWMPCVSLCCRSTRLSNARG